MGIEAALEARASTFAGLTALIGTTPTRFYPVEASQNANLPYVTYSVVSGARVHVMSADQVAQPRVQVDCWASSWVLARQLRDQVVAAFDRWSGVFGGVTVSASVCENEGIDVQPDEPSRTPRLITEFLVTYQL